MKPNLNFFKLNLILLLMIAGINLTAQHHPMKPPKEQTKEQIRAHKVAFLTDKLSLTPDEAQVFWPVYNEFEDKRETELRSFRDNVLEKYPDPILISDKEAEAMVDAHISHRERMLNMEKEYIVKFREVLPVRKVLLLLEAEKDFKKVLMDKIRKH